MLLQLFPLGISGLSLADLLALQVSPESEVHWNQAMRTKYQMTIRAAVPMAKPKPRWELHGQWD